jgi:hypothetical protein
LIHAELINNPELKTLNVSRRNLSAQISSSETRLIVQPIWRRLGSLLALHPGLDIRDAYGTIHLLTPDGSMKLGREAVAEALRSLPNTEWFAGISPLEYLSSDHFR